jgi:predicted  nucleic acid-binding Zn-ribbon protein
MSEKSTTINKGDRNKIFFLTIAIVALLGSNVYLYFRDKHENERFVTVNTEKDRLKLEVEKIEVELDKVSTINLQLNDRLIKEQDLARIKIAELKAALQKGQLTQGELTVAQKEIKELKEFVYNYNEEIVRLDNENLKLKTVRDSLQKSVEQINEKAEQLAQNNQELNALVKTSSALKAANVNVKAYKVKNNGKSVAVKSASSAKKIQVDFTVVSNQLATKDYHQIYLRVFDPAGNLLANEDNMFEADGQQMQYSDMITISFNDDNTAYSMQWVNPKDFIKGTYSVILYADGFEMGKGSLDLN